MSNSEAVPLVVYTDGERQVIGEALVSEDGHISATLNDDDLPPYIKSILLGEMTSFSLFTPKE